MTTEAEKELFLAIRANDAGAVRELVGEDRALLTALSPMGVSPVLFAAYYRHPEMARVLVQEGAALDIFEAAAIGETAHVRELLDADSALLNNVNSDGFSPLGLSAFFGQEEVAALLLSLGADANTVSQNAMQVGPLHSAVTGNHTNLVRKLLEAGADVNAVQNSGFTPLMGAAQNGNAELVRLLLSHGAGTGAVNEDGFSAADLAQEEGHGEVLILLAGPP
ncbi:ankyrin repeat domain-containing protein [Deinococcus sp. AJ005]|uniref:ankyrin repeat domain-containing protein n=1 Tax=Deinococcus sp. AJ005 TaxID=2652443 RepID=UPI00125CBDC1|nr:ankyrin repeat domain-containing protein [Deinococcus sp. AJ005]QFP77867.1 ankyrin repeat domain-containing protein [Deinococcus sp. AJ005]